MVLVGDAVVEVVDKEAVQGMTRISTRPEGIFIAAVPIDFMPSGGLEMQVLSSTKNTGVEVFQLTLSHCSA